MTADELLNSSYAMSGFAVCRGIIGEELTTFCATYAKVVATLDRMGGDKDVPEALSLYGDPAFDALLAMLTTRMSQVTGVELAPTYSFVRIYFEGQMLRVHRDRPACEHSLSLHLGASQGPTWPLGMETLDGSVSEIELAPGDGVAYRGIELAHWRGPCPADWYVQLFLHWVDRAGPNAGEALDRRDRLGVPALEVQGDD